MLGPPARPILTAPRAVDRFALLRCGLTVLCRSARLCGPLHDAVGRLEPASLSKSGGVRCCLRECVCHEHRTLPVRCPMGSAIASGSRLELDGARRLQVIRLLRPTGDFILYIYNNMLYDIPILECQISCMPHERSRTGCGTISVCRCTGSSSGSRSGAGSRRSLDEERCRRHFGMPGLDY